MCRRALAACAGADLFLARRQRHHGAVQRAPERRAAGRCQLSGRHRARGHSPVHSAAADERWGQLRSAHSRAFHAAGRPSRAGSRGHSSGIGVQPAGDFAKRRDGPDAADALHGCSIRRAGSVQSGGKHPRRRQLSEAAVVTLRPQRGAGARRV